MPYRQQSTAAAPSGLRAKVDNAAGMGYFKFQSFDSPVDALIIG